MAMVFWFRCALFGICVALALKGFSNITLDEAIQPGHLRLNSGAKLMLQVSGRDDFIMRLSFKDPILRIPIPEPLSQWVMTLDDIDDRYPRWVLEQKVVIEQRHEKVYLYQVRVPKGYKSFDLSKACKDYLTQVIMTRPAFQSDAMDLVAVQLLDHHWRRLGDCHLAVSRPLDLSSLNFTQRRSKEALSYRYAPIGVEHRVHLRKPTRLYLVDIEAPDATKSAASPQTEASSAFWAACLEKLRQNKKRPDPFAQLSGAETCRGQSQRIGALLKDLTAHLVTQHGKDSYYGFSLTLKAPSQPQSHPLGVFVMVAQTKEGTFIDFKDSMIDFQEETLSMGHDSLGNSGHVSLIHPENNIIPPARVRPGNLIRILPYSHINAAVLAKQQAGQPYQDVVLAQSQLYLEELGLYAAEYFETSQVAVVTFISPAEGAGQAKTPLAHPVLYQQTDGAWPAELLTPGPKQR